MTTYNLADLFETVADTVPDREAIITEDRRLTFGELEQRANRLAHFLRSRGVKAGDHIGLQLRNGNEYIEGMLAAYKLRAVPINLNYNYVEGELKYLYDDADLVALLVQREFTPGVVAVAPDVPKLATCVM
ncbi:MAG: AMP-binding protein, partial [Candidatus Binatia bacterium]